ncbi:wd-repeat protein [Tritrichomonas foetus]|uniref:Wd-repeat protein n=1 Tax=Tritrichomonas foetus TaxID=1144522 RepID=A0A1J4KQJ0_9EUKA|nr:wd-repeat protein [Tritrichomonas foetus]|eukprot:OHT13378.1 wd-repeat protein [Tritrichomonas foetus]
MGRLCRSLVLERSIQTLWTTGRIRQINPSFFATIRNYDVLIIDSEGKIFATLEAEEESEDTVNDFIVDSLLRFAFTSHASQLIKMWVPNNDEWEVVAQWRLPGKFPGYLQVDPDCQLLAIATSGQSCYFYALHNQSLVKKVDIAKGQITCMTYDSTGNLWIGDVFGHLSIIEPDSRTAKILKDEDAHRQRVTAIVAMPPYVVTSGLDEVILVFDTDGSQIGQPIGIAYSIHDLVVDPERQNCVYAATTDGVKRVNTADIRITKMSRTEVNQLFYFDQLYTFDNDGIIKSLNKKRSIVLTLHEIYDVAHDNTCDVTAVAAASNTNLIHIISEDSCFQLHGHTNTPLCLATSNGLLMSGSKDATARIWSLEEKKCLTVLLGHSDQVLAVAFVPKSDCVLTASKDMNMKLWRPTEEPELKSALYSVVAHNKDIEAIAVSIDGKMICTGSMDKTAKLWRIDNDKILPFRTLSGHRRGVSTVAFSPVEKIVVTGSSDNSIRIWSAEDGTCISSFTEFTSTILRAVFVNKGLQLATAESSGAVKVIRVKTGAPDFTNEEAHEGQIWGLSHGGSKQIITGGNDGKLCYWRDNTEELEAQETAEKAAATEAEQDLRNALRNGEYVKALKLAFKLRMPNKLRLVIREITEIGSTALVEYFSELEDLDDFAQWFDYIAKWATNSRWADDATAAITAILKVRQISFFIKNKKVFEAKIDAIIPYLERHQERLERLAVQTYAIDDVLENIPTE